MLHFGGIGDPRDAEAYDKNHGDSDKGCDASGAEVVIVPICIGEPAEIAGADL